MNASRRCSASSSRRAFEVGTAPFGAFPEVIDRRTVLVTKIPVSGVYSGQFFLNIGSNLEPPQMSEWR